MCYNVAQGVMSDIIDNKPVKQNSASLIKKVIPFLVLFFVLAITVGIFYFYRFCPGEITRLKTYGYLGVFLISLTLNATVILPAGNVLILSALAAILPSALIVGLVGGVGATMGEITGYVAGRSGRAILSKKRLYNRVERWINRWGAVVIFLFALLPLVFDLAGLSAGALRYPFWKFLLLCWLGRTLLYIGAALAGAWGWGAVLPYIS